MPTDSGDQRPTKPHRVGGPTQESGHLPCPRCDSTNTKFCYYNNYNVSQPRHFCKSCRRYWTHGGTLRDIPVGGGTRKNAKRSRTTTASLQDHDHHQIAATPTSILVPYASAHGCAVPFTSEAKTCGDFTSMLNATRPALFGLDGFEFELGLGTGYEDMNFGHDRMVWPIPSGPEVGATSSTSLIGDNTWETRE